MKETKGTKLNLMKFPPCPICGKDLIMPYGDPHYNGGHHLECENFDCGFIYKITSDGEEQITLERKSLELIKELMNYKNNKNVK